MDIDKFRFEREATKHAGRADRAHRKSEAGFANVSLRQRQVGAWVVLANGGALLLCFNGLLNNKICDWSAFTPLVWLFMLGLGASFTAFIVDQIFEQELSSAQALHGDESEFVAAQMRLVISLADSSEDARETKDKGKLSELLKLAEGALEDANACQARLNEISKKLARQWYVLFSSSALSALGIGLFAFGLLSAVGEPRFARAVCGYVAPAASDSVDPPRAEPTGPQTSPSVAHP